MGDNQITRLKLYSPETISRVGFRTGLSEASVARVFERAPCALDISRENDSDSGLVSYVWTLDFGEGVFVVRQGPRGLHSMHINGH